MSKPNTATLEKSDWAKRFKATSPSSYKKALEYVADPAFRVEVQQTNESGDWQWAICAASHNPAFWMDARPCKKEALALCKTMGWKLL